MSEQVVQTYITWTHGAQPTWLQFHGPGALLDRPIRQTTSPPPPPSFPLLLPPPPPPPPPPPVILHPQFMPSVRSPSISAPRGQSCPATSKSQRTRRSIYSTDHSRDEELHSPGRSSKRSRTASASASRRSPCFPPNELAVNRCPHRQIASITVMPSCTMGGNVFRLVFVDDQDIIIAGVHGINGDEAQASYITNLAAVSHLEFEKLPCIPSAECGCHGMCVLTADFRLLVAAAR